MKKAVVLFSGGLDSTTAIYYAKSMGYDVHAITFFYGQKHNKEIESAKKICSILKISDHKIISTSLDSWGGSSLTDTNISIPNGVLNSSDIPSTYVPARNMIFLSFAASYAEAINSQDIFIGVSEVDYSGYVDCRKEFIDAMENAINLGTVASVEKGNKIKIHTPFINMKKSEEIKLGMSLNVDYSQTWSCYKGLEFSCGKCDSCLLRIKAFNDAGFKDPILYLE